MSESTEEHEDEQRVGEAAGTVDVEGTPEEEPEPEGRSKAEALEEDLIAEGDIAADYLEELLDIADMDGDIDTYTESGRAHISIVTEDRTLVGEGGEVLEALQELSRLAVMTETGHRSRLMLDIAGHREQRRRELQMLARDAINEVGESGGPVRLSPMNPFERKIVHDAVAAAGLSSESEGTEPQRCVVIRPAG
ncbi:R3H domain-containing nucleic acid-binding protein [uncultured Propionibacterium sp.]|uniref:Jag family protein n=1 Tax=uncultured Propionibacterium sp. TaxID=218066 RepID=UPI00292CAD4A|nr:R3H domain-containing nucleic acid-binding protein [uncultured Propionibacterium sp.]